MACIQQHVLAVFLVRHLIPVQFVNNSQRNLGWLSWILCRFIESLWSVVRWWTKRNIGGRIHRRVLCVIQMAPRWWIVQLLQMSAAVDPIDIHRIVTWVTGVIHRNHRKTHLQSAVLNCMFSLNFLYLLLRFTDCVVVLLLSCASCAKSSSSRQHLHCLHAVVANHHRVLSWGQKSTVWGILYGSSSEERPVLSCRLGSPVVLWWGNSRVGIDRHSRRPGYH